MHTMFFQGLAKGRRMQSILSALPFLMGACFWLSKAFCWIFLLFVTHWWAVGSVLAEPEWHSGGGFLLSEITGSLLTGKLEYVYPFKAIAKEVGSTKLFWIARPAVPFPIPGCNLRDPFTVVLVHGAWQRSAVHQSFSTQKAWMLTVQKWRGDAFHACGGVQKCFPWNSRAWKVIRDDHKWRGSSWIMQN